MDRPDELAAALMALGIRGHENEATPRDIRVILSTIADELRWRARTVDEVAGLFRQWAHLTRRDPRRLRFWARAAELSIEAMRPRRTDGRREEVAHA